MSEANYSIGWVTEGEHFSATGNREAVAYLYWLLLDDDTSSVDIEDENGLPVDIYHLEG